MRNPEQDEFGDLRARPTARTPACPLEQELVMLGEHQLTPQREDELLSHCATCDHCAAILKEALELAEPLTEEEQSLVENLPSTKDGKALARKLVKGWAAPRWWMPLAAAFLVCALIPAGYVGWQYYADRQIAAEVAKARPIEFRLDGIGYGPYRALLGNADAIVSAEGKRETWRAAVLERDLDEALRRLKTALEKDKDNAAIFNDLAAVHAGRGDWLRLPSEYEAALLWVDKALAKEPQFHAALFNRMLILDRLKRREESRQAARRVLAVESDSGWRSEAQSLLEKP